MFQLAYERASQFTQPVVSLYRARSGECGWGIGTFVILNDEGWIATAHHVVNDLLQVTAQVVQNQTIEAGVAALEADGPLHYKDRQKQVRELRRNAPPIDRAQIAFGVFGSVSLNGIQVLPEVDLAIGQLEPFDKSLVTGYPVLKNPSLGLRHGASLCKLGYPFHEIAPTWDEDQQTFDVPPGTFPIAIFPLEGIYTRDVVLEPRAGVPAPPFPLMWLETSSPGLKGQSGGPIFDTQGSVWGIQCGTLPLAMDIQGKVRGSGPTLIATEQFLNVGLGVHPATLTGFLDMHGVRYNASDY